ncbi:MAG: pyridoxamine 5'-phosphate oxidase family protein [Deltaproteobacteria bacterium]|nr:pyridoxamine 5'-phosphate oxidase family protein [Deltaproteobacteria bacterium]
MPSLAPDSLSSLITQSFTDRKRPAYGQLATADLDGTPHVRAVHFHLIPEREALAFNCHTLSAKWQQLSQNSRHEGCFFDPYRLVQIRWRGIAEPLNPRDPNEKTFLDQMWLRMRPDVRGEYWIDCGGKSSNVSERAPNLGTILCRPFLWDIYKISQKEIPTVARLIDSLWPGKISFGEYGKGERTIHELKNGRWVSRKVSLLNGK